jgi:hypothetical protein
MDSLIRVLQWTRAMEFSNGLAQWSSPMDSRNGIVHGTTSIEPCMVREYGGHRPKGPRPTFGGNFSNGAVTRQRASCLVGSSSAWCLVGGA